MEPELLLDDGLPAELRVEVVHRCHFVSMKGQHCLLDLASKYLSDQVASGNLYILKHYHPKNQNV